MKQISARQFRTSFADLTEPVLVIRRNEVGSFDRLGMWVPDADVAGVMGLEPPVVGPKFVPAPGFGHPSPAPKPGDKKR